MPIGLTNLFGSLFGGPASLTPVNTTALIPASQTGGDIRLAFGEFLMGQDRIISDLFNYPWKGPDELDNYGNETQRMRLDYRRQFLTEPVVGAAIWGKVSRVCGLDLAVMPASKNPVDKGIAKFIKFALDNSEHGTHGLIRNLYAPSLIDGWSLCETVLEGVTNGTWNGLIKLRHCRQLDTLYCRLQLDQFRNVTGIVNLRAGIQIYPDRKALMHTHNGMYSNPFGNSDLRACWRYVNLIEDTYRAWFVAIMRYGTPYVVGKYSQAQNKEAMRQSIQELYSGGYMVTDNESSVEVLALASGSNFNAFEAKVNKLREEVMMKVNGTYQPFLEGSGGAGSHGDTAVAKVSSDSYEYMAAKDLALTINRGLIPILVEENFGREYDYPAVVIAGTNWAETEAQLKVGAMLLKDYDLPLNRDEVYDAAQWSPPDSGPEDTVLPMSKRPQPGAASGSPALASVPTGGLGGNPNAKPAGTMPDEMPDPAGLRKPPQPSMPQTFAAATSDEAKRCVDRILANSKRLAA